MADDGGARRATAAPAVPCAATDATVRDDGRVLGGLKQQLEALEFTLAFALLLLPAPFLVLETTLAASSLTLDKALEQPRGAGK